MNAEDRKARIKHVEALMRYRNKNFRVYAWADHIFNMMVFAATLSGFAMLVNGAVAGFAFVGVGVAFLVEEGVRGVYELRWIEEWMKNDT